MNCLDFRRICLIEPSSRDPRLYLHLYHCACCKAFRKRLLAAEAEMHDVMQVPVPEGLDRKIVFDTEMQSTPERRGLVWQMAAASLLLVLALGMTFTALNARPDVVPALAMHMADDPLHMAPAQVDASQRLDQVLRHLGGSWQGPKPEITHATVCLVKERAAAHLVVAGEQGPVTVFLLPRLKVRERHGLAVDGQLVEVLSLDEGSVAVFGYQGESFDRIAGQFAAGVRWTESQAQRKPTSTLVSAVQR